MKSSKSQYLICYGPTTLVFTLPHRTQLTRAVKNELVKDLMDSEFGQSHRINRDAAIEIVNSGKLLKSLPEKVSSGGKEVEVVMVV